MNPLRLLLLFVFLLSPLLTACQSKVGVEKFNQALAHSLNVDDLDDHTFAIYNNDNQLISTPIAELKTNLKNTKAPFTDIAIVAHGWNYTHQESIANYYKYMAAGHKLSGEVAQSGREPSRIHFIFIVWPSVTRPFSDAAYSIFPGGVEDIVAPPLGVIDKVFFHIPSAWAESMDAFEVGIGASPSPSGPPPWTMSFKGLAAGNSNRELPVSSIVREVLNMREAGLHKCKVHLVGHSYGAKVMTFAGLHALKNYQGKPIDTLVGINAAFHPNELNMIKLVKDHTPIDWVTDVKMIEYREKEDLGGETFEKINKKAFLYSNYDSATGWVFDLSQFPFNNARIVASQSLLKDAYREPDSLNKVWKYSSSTPQILYNLIMSPALYFGTKLSKLPRDYVDHIRHNDTFGTRRSWYRDTFNAAHFFVPIDKLCPRQNPTMRGILRPTIPAIGSVGLHDMYRGRKKLEAKRIPSLTKPDELGPAILKSTTELAPTLDYSSLEDLIDEASHINRDMVYKWLSTPINANDHALAKLSKLSRKRIYSIDMTEIYDTWMPPGNGAHGDLGSLEIPRSKRYDRSKIELTSMLISRLIAAQSE